MKKKIEENVLESGHLNIHIEKTKCSAEQAGKVSQWGTSLQNSDHQEQEDPENIQREALIGSKRRLKNKKWL